MFFWSSRPAPSLRDTNGDVCCSAAANNVCRAIPINRQPSYRLLTYSAIVLACPSVNPEVPLLCGGLLPASPLVKRSTI